MSEDNKTPECLIPALRQYRHNRGDGLVAAYDYDLVNKEIATKDAELARLREALNEAKRRLRRGIVIPKDIADSIDEALKPNDIEDSE